MFNAGSKNSGFSQWETSFIHHHHSQWREVGHLCNSINSGGKPNQPAWGIEIFWTTNFKMTNSLTVSPWQRIRAIKLTGSMNISQRADSTQLQNKAAGRSIKEGSMLASQRNMNMHFRKQGTHRKQCPHQPEWYHSYFCGQSSPRPRPTCQRSLMLCSLSAVTHLAYTWHGRTSPYSLHDSHGSHPLPCMTGICICHFPPQLDLKFWKGRCYSVSLEPSNELTHLRWSRSVCQMSGHSLTLPAHQTPHMLNGFSHPQQQTLRTSYGNVFKP